MDKSKSMQSDRLKLREHIERQKLLWGVRDPDKSYSAEGAASVLSSWCELGSRHKLVTCAELTSMVLGAHFKLKTPFLVTDAIH